MYLSVVALRSVGHSSQKLLPENDFWKIAPCNLHYKGYGVQFSWKERYLAKSPFLTLDPRAKSPAKKCWYLPFSKIADLRTRLMNIVLLFRCKSLLLHWPLHQYLKSGHLFDFSQNQSRCPSKALYCCSSLDQAWTCFIQVRHIYVVASLVEA